MLKLVEAKKIEIKKKKKDKEKDPSKKRNQTIVLLENESILAVICALLTARKLTINPYKCLF